VDLDRYLGLWYEIASFPAWFQRGCTAVTAEYSRREKSDFLLRESEDSVRLTELIQKTLTLLSRCANNGAQRAISALARGVSGTDRS
jgi:hypothetical protein